MITYYHKRAPIALGDGRYDCCLRVDFPQGVPDTDGTPMDDDGESIYVYPIGEGTIEERLDTQLRNKIVHPIASSRGFSVTAVDVERVSPP